jgi:site-specific DNA-methyltransferase (adenine-specific)
MSYQIMTGDCREVLRTMADNSIDSIVTDPPYGLSFMGKAWDKGVPGVEFWTEMLRVIKPGGHLLSFGGSRTYHRMASAIEDAGWEIRDQIMWIYGSGFPKSHNGAWGGTALKPAHEPIVMARKPLIGTVAANVLAHGTGAININVCRVEWPNGAVPEIGTPGWAAHQRCSRLLSAAPGMVGDTVDRNPPSRLGRWPANVIHDGSDEVITAFPSAPGQIANAKTSGDCKTRGIYGVMRYGRDGEPSADSANVGAVGFAMKPGARRLDAGSAARFFYCAKPSKAEREAGCGYLTPDTTSDGPAVAADNAYQRGKTERLNTHPTVKPTELMRYLCRLVTPAGGTILDPFMGSGSTGRGAVLEGFDFIGIEMDADYTTIADARIREAYLKEVA